MTESLRTARDSERQSSQRETGATAVDQRACPECSGTIRPDQDTSERTCTDCGLVVAEDDLDRGPEWRTHSAEESAQRSRVGAPVTALQHDHGLSTTISWQDRDANGNALSPEKLRRIRRLRTWDERFRTKSSLERNLRHAFGEIERMGSALGLPEPCRETGAVTYRQAVDDDLLPGRSIEAMATASLYGAARQHGIPRSLPTFATVSRVDKLPIQRAYRYLSRELGLGIAPAHPLDYLHRYASALEVNTEVEQLARDILDCGEQQDLHVGRSPAGLAAAALYAGAQLCNEHLTQATVSDTTDVSRLTIRNRYQELLEVYGEETS